MSTTMNSNGKASTPGKASPFTHSSNQAILLEKLNVRKSTPDSEALASSDDEGDGQRSGGLSELHSVTQQQPARRSSWLNDTIQSGSQLRKASFSSSMQPPANLSSTDAATLTGHLPSAVTPVRAHPGSATLWSQGIWSADASRKDASSRLAEVLPSPTSMYPPGSTGSPGVHEANQQGSSRSRDPTANNFPFAIPLQPTLKTIRSQSYSVGQQEYDALISPGLPGSAVSPAFAGRRDRQHSAALQHRPSRPSMLSEVSNDNNGLGNVREVEDDDDESTNDGSLQGGVGLQSTEHRTIEFLARENAMLRQQQNYQNARQRARAPSVNAIGSNFMVPSGIRQSLIEESDYAVDEIDEVAELQGLNQKGFPGRRMSEYSAVQGMPQHMSIENRKLENLKKGTWSTSLGFNGLSDIPQSRRHSFADTLPARQGSVGSIGEPQPSRDHVDDSSREYAHRYHESIGQNSNDPAAASYFTTGTTGMVSPYSRASESFGSHRPTSSSLSQPAVYQPSSSMYQQFGSMSLPHRDQPLYVVLFKCSRADIFYIQEGTGLQVKPGDLCIVEADRGTDLGTVAHDNVTWAEAKKYKEHYAEEHYKWLMMYSATSANNPDGSFAGLMAAGNGTLPSAIGGMGPQNSVQESPSGEIRPKIIKRVAQAHEIQSLREKEGNEAKAKRMCTQKVKEHQLKMEILDAEFQMDLKKLTFYYFAESYVNFNLLVTDLFKVYKTRIWMSAINPASFASPSVGLQAPSGVGPGAVGVRNMLPDRRIQQQDQAQGYGNRSYEHGYSQPFATGPDRAMMPQSSYQTAPTEYPPYGYTPFAAAPRNMNAPMPSYNPTMMQHMESAYPSSGYATPVDFQTNSGRYPSPHGGAPQDDYARQGTGHNGGGEGWMNSFQGLSLNSR